MKDQSDNPSHHEQMLYHILLPEIGSVIVKTKNNHIPNLSR